MAENGVTGLSVWCLSGQNVQTDTVWLIVSGCLLSGSLLRRDQTDKQFHRGCLRKGWASRPDTPWAADFALMNRHHRSTMCENGVQVVLFSA